MTVVNTILSMLPIGAFAVIVVAVVLSEIRRRREEEAERRIYKTGVWLSDR